MNMIKDLQAWMAAAANVLGKNENDPVVKSGSSYVSYLNNATGNILNCPGSISVPTRYNGIFSGNDYLNIIEGFIANDDLIFALTIAEIVLKYSEKGVEYHKANDTPLRDKSYKGLRDSCAALRSLICYLKSSQIWIDKKKWNSEYNKSDLNGIRNIILKPDVHKIDGNECLVNARAVDFIRLAIENSFFFDPGSAIARHAEIVDCINNNVELPARWSSEAGVYNQPVKTKKDGVKASGLIYKSSYPVKIDGNGNAQVKAQISLHTGYTVSGGVDSIFQSYKISHIWGNAFDPRYFTNLWNIVLVPAWANDLLDKDEYAPGATKLIVKLKSTFKAICLKHYQMSSGKYDFNVMQNWTAPSHLAKLQRGTYLINVIGKRSEGDKIATIRKEPVRV